MAKRVNFQNNFLCWLTNTIGSGGNLAKINKVRSLDARAKRLQKTIFILGFKGAKQWVLKKKTQNTSFV